MRTELKTHRAAQPAGCCWRASCCCSRCSCRASAARVNGARRWLNLGVLELPGGRSGEAALHRVAGQLPRALPRRGQRDAGRRCSSRSASRRRWSACCCCSRTSVRSSLMLAITAGMLVLGGVNMPRMFGAGADRPAGAGAASRSPSRTACAASPRSSIRGPTRSTTATSSTNALMAVGRGEWFGVGLGASVQKLFYLPEAHTDFILAVIAEELGFVGVCAGDRAVRAARRSRVLDRAAVRRDAPPLRRLLRLRHRAVDRACRASCRSA